MGRRSAGPASVLGGALLAAAFLAALSASAEPAPAESTDEQASVAEALEPRVDTSSGFDAPAAPESPQPDAVLAADITRSQSGGRVMDRMELGRTEITGNQELPKVMYIVPWQKGNPGDLMGKPVNTLLDEILAPIDREEFVRAVDYYGELYGDDDDQD